MNPRQAYLAGLALCCALGAAACAPDAKPTPEAGAGGAAAGTGGLDAGPEASSGYGGFGHPTLPPPPEPPPPPRECICTPGDPGALDGKPCNPLVECESCYCQTHCAGCLRCSGNGTKGYWGTGCLEQ